MTTEDFPTSIAPVGNTTTALSGITMTRFDDGGIGSITISATDGWNAHIRAASFGGLGGNPRAEWVFPEAINAFALEIKSSGNPSDISLSGDFDGTGIQSIGLISQSIIASDDQFGFIGVIGESSFDTLTFTLPDNLALISTRRVDFNAVPEPSSMALIFLGAGVVLLRRKQS